MECLESSVILESQKKMAADLHVPLFTSCSQGKIRSPDHCLKLEKWQGPPHINTVKQHENESCCPLRFGFFTQFV